MVTKIGMIGLNEGNGHPFSFSAIINGFNRQPLIQAGWKVIHDYLCLRDPSEFGFEGVQVTHAWTQDEWMTQLLCQACFIPHAVNKMEDMINEVDAVIIARDDYENHWAMASPFLEKGLHVFVDKPLALNIEQLQQFTPYLDSGQLMSGSGMRYAAELDHVRQDMSGYGELVLMRAAGVNSWEKYGVHLLEAILPIVSAQPASIRSLPVSHSAKAITMSNHSLLEINTFNDVPCPFQIEFWGSKKKAVIEINDHFSMFRRMLWHFIHSITTGQPAIPVHETLTIMRVLMAGQISAEQKRNVHIHEIIL